MNQRKMLFKDYQQSEVRKWLSVGSYQSKMNERGSEREKQWLYSEYMGADSIRPYIVATHSFSQL